MLTPTEISDILAEISYKDWGIYYNPEGQYIQIVFVGKDIYSQEEVLQRCRKWKVSLHMTKSEIVCTVWAAIQAAEKHEAAERFTYKGVRIFNPHVDVEALVTLHSSAFSQDVRAPFPTDFPF